MTTDKMAKYAQASIGERDYRWTVKGNGDCPGNVDIILEAWVDTERRWKVTHEIECIPLVVLNWLTQQAATVVSIEDGEKCKEIA